MTREEKTRDMHSCTQLHAGPNKRKLTGQHHQCFAASHTHSHTHNGLTASMTPKRLSPPQRRILPPADAVRSPAAWAPGCWLQRWAGAVLPPCPASSAMEGLLGCLRISVFRHADHVMTLFLMLVSEDGESCRCQKTKGLAMLPPMPCQFSQGGTAGVPAHQRCQAR